MSLDCDALPILEAALAGGGQMSELFLERSTGLMIVMDDGKVEKVLGGVDQGAGLRLIYDLKTAYAYGNQFSQEALLPLAGNLALLSQGKPVAPQEMRPVQPGLVTQALKPFKDTATAIKVDMVKAAEAAAREVDSRISQVRVIYMDRGQQVRILNSLGVEAEEERSQIIMAVHCVATQDGRVQTGYESMGGIGGMEIFERKDPTQVAKEAARRAVLMLEADPAPGGSMPVVLSAEAGGTMVHEAVGHGLEGDLVYENMSVYAGRIGEKVASELVTVLDDGTVAGRRGSGGFDDEGTPCRKNVVIDKGVLTGYLQDRLSAWKLEAEPTGNGRRESYRHRPIPRMTNTMIAPGTDDPESIVRSTGEGLFVRKMGGGQVNTINGDFVFEVSEGYLIKDGKVDRPVRGATLTGNGPEVLSQIDLVGNDLGWSLGTCGKDGQGSPVGDAQPTLRIPRLVVGGQQQG
ncbi:MAG: TldD/PmbA family protein [Desulfarculaceae bacterium]|nr:TldD/PmbA family protein [Desulfarculaceae bacterium]MCF8049005.1 TldD/PmbA family protein [Desulfarculaceae bacterium]MCF8065595.1 TldD/PmbA family protein [Desulfarculaceae bacterium]MCF8098667.1 TldD/PmbA family protein [Desulfarculaceae bacterium]MCF8124047.1 TldD/PmbA family protein [Desulfarculaceae bacterium]